MPLELRLPAADPWSARVQRRPPTDAARILVTDGRQTGQARSTLATVRALHAGGYRPITTVSGPVSVAGASRACAGRLPVPPLPDPGFRRGIDDELARRPYLMTMATSDDAVRALGQSSVALLDKRVLAARASAAGLEPAPGTVLADVGQLRRSVHDLDLPLVVKPVLGGWPAVLLSTPSDAATLPPDTRPILVQPFLGGGIRSVAGVMWRGQMVAAVHQRYVRTWPRLCGVSSYAETVGPDRSLEAALARLLGTHDGIFQAQFAGTHLLDLNPRPYGSLPLAVAAGVNLPSILADLVSGREPLVGRPRVGVRYRWIEGDARHLAEAARAGDMTPRAVLSALTPVRGTCHSVVALRDPGPTIARAVYVQREARR